MLGKLAKDLRRKPLTAISALLAGMVMLYALLHLATRGLYVESLYWVDATTLLLLAGLWLRAVATLRQETDLQTLSTALLAVLSFAFCYEALYKLSFYLPPRAMPPQELREFVIQVGVALTILAGFAEGRLRFTRASGLSAGLFALEWLLWLAVGYPQLKDPAGVYSPLLGLTLGYWQVYALNRATKATLFLVYFFLFKPRLSGRRSQGAPGP